MSQSSEYTLVLGSVTKWDNKPHLGSWATQQWDLYLESMTPLSKQLLLTDGPGYTNHWHSNPY